MIPQPVRPEGSLGKDERPPPHRVIRFGEQARRRTSEGSHEAAVNVPEFERPTVGENSIQDRQMDRLVESRHKDSPHLRRDPGAATPPS
jgi:hypothetical protein